MAGRNGGCGQAATPGGDHQPRWENGMFRLTGCTSLILIFLTGLTAAGRAQDAPPLPEKAAPAQTESAAPAQPAEPAPAAPASGTGSDSPGYQLQSLDDPATPLKPVEGRTGERDRQVTSTAWYMTGRIMQKREQYREALEAYEKAEQLDPSSVTICRSLIEVSMQLRDMDRVLKYATRAVELDPDDFELSRQLGVQMVGQRRLDDAVRFLEQALKSPRLDHKSGFYVLLNRDLGILYGGLGEFEKAADCYEVLLEALKRPAQFGLNVRVRDELQKDANTSWQRIGEVLLRANRVEPARIALEEALKERNGRGGAVNYLLAQLNFQQEKYDTALEQLDLFFESRLKRGRGPYLLLQQLLAKSGQEDALLDRLETLRKGDPGNHDLEFFLADTYIERDRLDDAERIYRASIADAPSPEAYLGLAKIYRRQNKARELLDSMASVLESGQELEAIAESFESELKAIREDRELLDALLAAGRADGAAAPAASQYARSFLLARLATGAERIDEAVEFFRKALEANPSAVVLVYREYGEALIGAERYSEAVDVYRAAAGNALAQSARPQNLLMLSVALEMSGQTDAALEVIAEVNGLIPDNSLIEFREAWIYYHAQRFDQAIEKFEAYLQKHGGTSFARQAQFSLSNIYVQKGEIRKGEEILEKFLAENPDDPGVNNDLGYLYADQGKNLEKARSMIEKAVQAEPENAAYLDSMGWVMFKLEKFEESRVWLEKAIKLGSGGDSTIWDHLGDCHHRLKQIDQARIAWDKALKLAREEPKPDEKLVNQIEEKLKIHQSETGKPAATPEKGT